MSLNRGKLNRRIHRIRGKKTKSSEKHSPADLEPKGLTADGTDQRFKQISGRLGITREQTRQIYARAMHRPFSTQSFREQGGNFLGANFQEQAHDLPIVTMDDHNLTPVAFTKRSAVGHQGKLHAQAPRFLQKTGDHADRP